MFVCTSRSTPDCLLSHQHAARNDSRWAPENPAAGSRNLQLLRWVCGANWWKMKMVHWCTLENHGKLTTPWNVHGHWIGGIWSTGPGDPGALIQIWKMDSTHYGHSAWASHFHGSPKKGTCVGLLMLYPNLPGTYIACSRRIKFEMITSWWSWIAKQLIMSCKGIPETSSQPE